MDDRKIEYLKKHLEQALSAEDHNEINSCYQELLKFVSAADVPELAQRVSDYNRLHSEDSNKKMSDARDNVKQNIRAIKKTHNRNVKVQRIGIGGGLAALLLAMAFVMMGEDALGSMDMDVSMKVGILFFIIGCVLVFVGTVFTFLKKKSEPVLNKRRREVFRLICEGEDKLRYLEHVETIDDTYMGQVMNDEPSGFGVGICLDNNIYVGNWENGSKNGIGRLISDDLLMTLEGEFLDDEVDGVVDIKWEDGSEWHGEYRNGAPWDGRGKTIVNNKVMQGVWKSGNFIS